MNGSPRNSLSLVPLNTLRAFEATARHMSLKEAASELRVTPSAVSHRLRLLQKILKCELLHREGARLKLTEPGSNLALALTAGFTQIDRALDDIRDSTAIAQSPVKYKKNQTALRKIVATISLISLVFLGTNAIANEVDKLARDNDVQARAMTVPSTAKHDGDTKFCLSTSGESCRVDVPPPASLAIVACRTEQRPHDENRAASHWREVQWRMPVACMRAF